MTINVNIHEAKTHLSRLLEQVAAGEQVIMAKAGTPFADLVPHQSHADSQVVLWVLDDNPRLGSGPRADPISDSRARLGCHAPARMVRSPRPIKVRMEARPGLPPTVLQLSISASGLRRHSAAHEQRPLKHRRHPRAWSADGDVCAV